jgi:ligand-binding sensor domain-containing protein
MLRISILFPLLLAFNIHYGYGQDGNIFLKHYANSGTGMENPTWDIKQANNEIMYFATSNGVLSYDGVKWKNIKCPGPAFALTIDPKTERLYIACQNNFGYIQSDKNGNEYYKSLLSTEDDQTISKVCIIGNNIYYYNNQNIYRINLSTNQLENITSIKKNKGVIRHKNNLYVNIQNKGIHRLEEDKLKYIPINKWKAEDELLFSIDFNDRYTLIGMHSNNLYLFNGVQFKKFIIDSQNYLDENILVGAKEISKTSIVVSTLAGGCLIINKNTGKTEAYIHYQSGLPDNEVSAMEPDKEKGLWLAHGQGLTRASLDDSFKNFSSYPGLEGYLISVISYNHTLYAATNEGVYYLDAAKDHEEYKKIIHESKEAKNFAKHSLLGRNKEVPGKRFFSSLFSGKEKVKYKEYSGSDKDHQNTGLDFHGSVNYIFRKTINFHGKCKQLIISDNHLLALSSIGLYEIDKKSDARLILKNDEINLIYNPPSSNKIYAGLKKGLIAIRPAGTEWKVENDFKIKCPVYSLCEDSLNQLWISSSGKILKLEFNKKGRQIQYKEYFIDEKTNENATIQKIHGKITFFLPSSVYYYEYNDDNIQLDTLFTSNNTSEYFVASQENITWHKSKEAWTALDAISETNDFTSPMLSLFKDIKNIFLDNDENLWIIDGKDELYRIEKQYRLVNNLTFNLHIREITNDNGKLLTLNELELDHTNKSVNFYFAAPHFLDESSTKYQYFLKGMMEDWSAWSNNSLLKFPFLPSGEYHLQVRAKNIWGNVSNIKSVEFKIHPPFWKKNWFYFSEILFFSLLIILSIVLNQKKKNFFLTKILAFVTLIIIIEFIHNLVSSVINVGVMDNPLMRLGADVMLALLISPIEKILEVILFKRKRQIAQLAILYRKKIAVYTDNIKVLF